MAVNKRLIGAGAAGGAFVNNENFRAILYTGDDSTGRNITGVGFKPDFIWIKPRNQTENHNIYDTTRGATKQFIPNSTAASSTQGNTVQSFDADGFTLNGDNNVNKSGINYIAWCWKAGGGTTSSNSDGSITSTVQANTNSGFSIVKWTGTQSSATVGHGLGIAPKMVITKSINTSQGWATLVRSSSTTFAGLRLNENGANSSGNGNTFFQNTAPTTSVFTLGASDESNPSGSEVIAYCFADVSGFQKIDTYSGNGSTTGPLVNLGFEPAFLMIKRTDSSDNWTMYDNKRTTTNPRNLALFSNLTSSELSSGLDVDFLSNGFQIKSSDNSLNNGSGTYLYWAVAANPDTEEPTLASSFNIELYQGTGSDPLVINGLGFSPGFVWIKVRDASREHILSDIVRGPDKELSTNDTSAEESRGVKSFDSDGFTLDNATSNYNHNGENYVAWTWKANDNEPTINTNGSLTSIVSANDNSGFSIVSYTGDGNSARTVGHGLSAKCDLVIIKDRDNVDKWVVQLPQLGDNARMVLEGTAGKTDDSTTTQAGNATVFGIGGDNAVNKDGDNYIAYCFRSVTGYQKIGSYTGDNSAGQAITTGFKPDFVLIKSTVGNDNWRLYDTKRGITSGFLEPNRTDADDTSDAPNLTITSTGFTITSGGNNQGNNASGNLYIYLAIAKNVSSNTTLANSFKTVTYTGNGNSNRTITGVGFNPDLVWIKARSTSEQHYIYDKLRGPFNYLHPNLNNAEATDSSTRLKEFNDDGFVIGNELSVNQNGETFVAWCWKAGNTWQSNIAGTIPSLVNVNTANGFSVVKYKGNETASQTIGHGLSSAPEIALIKQLDGTRNWQVPLFTQTSGDYLVLNSDGVKATDTTRWSAVSSTTFTVGAQPHTNGSGSPYIAYMFHSVAGYSKVGTYTGQTSGVTVTTGFRPTFLLIKSTSNVEHWAMLDTVRGSGKVINANRSNAETDSTLNTFTVSDTGFSFPHQDTADAMLNENGYTYIYLAIKE